MMRLLVLMALGLLAGCDALPRDPDGTQKTIETSKRFSVASADGAALREDKHVARLIAELEQRTRAKAQWHSESGEVALKDLSEGKLDLVIGHFRRDSPWQTEVAFGPPLSSAGPKDDPIELKPAMRNGENRWVMTVERATRAVSATARAQ